QALDDRADAAADGRTGILRPRRADYIAVYIAGDHTAGARRRRVREKIDGVAVLAGHRGVIEHLEGQVRQLRMGKVDANVAVVCKRAGWDDKTVAGSGCGDSSATRRTD